MLFEYDGYELNTNWYDMEDKEQDAIVACSWMVKNRSTIRETASIFSYAPTTFWRRIHNECRQLSPELYGRVVKQMKKNLERRGKV